MDDKKSNSFNETSNKIHKLMEQAFQSVLEKSLIDIKNIDITWLAKLFKEIRERLCNLTPNNIKHQNYITNGMDDELFIQMIKNDAMTHEDLKNLIKFVFNCILSLQSPIRDPYTKKIMEELLSNFENKNIGQCVAHFVIQANKCIDFIYEDIKTFNNKNI